MSKTKVAIIGSVASAARTMANLWRCSSRVSVGQPDTGRLRWNDDLSMGWIGVARAWMGDGDGALDALLNGWVTSTLKTNGFLTEQSKEPAGRREMMWMQNQLCGMVNGVNEMLLQSERTYVDPANPDEDHYIVELLPALPSAWPAGHINGLRARGGLEIDEAWADGKLTTATLRSPQGTACKIQYGRTIIDLTIKPGETVTLDSTLTRK